MTELDTGITTLQELIADIDDSLESIAPRLTEQRAFVTKLEQQQRELTEKRASLAASIETLRLAGYKSEWEKWQDEQFARNLARKKAPAEKPCRCFKCRANDDRGSTLIALAVVCLIFGAIVATCLYFASQADTRPLIERVENTGQWIGGAL